MLQEFLWVEKYRPKKLEDVILPADLKATFKKFVEDENIPNLILAGGAGIGKTTIAKAMLEELGCSYIVINGSMNGNIDTLRTDIKNFASTVSFDGKRKYVILDEADYLTQFTQPALRNFMEEYSSNCGFILTCNFLNKIIEPLHSRCSVIHFKIDVKDKPKLAAAFYRRVMDILSTEEVEADGKVVAELITHYFPDFRRVLNELQRYSATGKIDSSILSSISDENIKTLMNTIKQKDFNLMRKWVAENINNEPAVIFRKIYDGCFEIFEPSSIPQLILLLGEYQYKSAFVVDQEINFVAFLTEVMASCQIKE